MCICSLSLSCHGGKQLVKEIHHFFIIRTTFNELVLRQLSISININFSKESFCPDFGISRWPLAAALKHVINTVKDHLHLFESD